MNKSEKDHIEQALAMGVRLDGRGNEDFRPIEIETNILSTAEGSAKVKCGNTEVIVGIKMEVGKPYPDSKDQGVLMVGAELLPLSNPLFESGPPGIDSIETARVIDRGIREGKAIDTKKLCVREGELVWTVLIDIAPINYDGNLIDIGGLAALAALKSAKMPELKDDQMVIGSKTSESLPVIALPIPVTVGKIGQNFIVDPTDAEENGLDARLTVSVLEDGTLCAMQKGGDSSLSVSDIKAMVDLAVKKSQELRQKLKEALR